MKISGVIVALLILSAFACKNDSSVANTGNSAADELTVSAAISLKDAFTEIGKKYEDQTGTKIAFNFGASGILQKQIEGGAPVDVFASAGEPQMNALEDKRLIEYGSRIDFTGNSLVMVVPVDSKLSLDSFAGLANTDIERIATGNPKTVPAGEYADQTFDFLGISETVKPKLIFGEDVRQVLEYVVRGEVDVGVIYATDAQVAGGKVRVAATAPDGSHKPILYPIATVKGSKQIDAARKFINFVLSDDGQNVLRRFGFSALKI